MEMAIHEEDIVIVGAGLSDSLRITGLALTLWSNAWRALDAVGIGDILRQKSVQIHGFKFANQEDSTPPTSGSDVNFDKLEVRCVRRKELLETLERELPQGTIRYSSKVDSIDESGNSKLIHLADGSVIRTKVLIGCDGINSTVARWLGLQSPVSSGRSAIRGFVDYPDGHGFEPKFHTYFGGGLRYGFIPCDDRSVYWFCTFKRSVLKCKPSSTFLCILLCKNDILHSDALHPMPPDIGQGGCSALEDGVILARCLAEALLADTNRKDDEYVKMEKGLEKYSRERRWRSFSLVCTAYVVGLIQESDGKVMRFLRKKFLSRFTVGAVVKMAEFDCGKLVSS
ncbi:hypothetical protein BUALT_Bualt08G0089100 [Buddleja alternifolia]|uniref:FAD-binding domain-containing protein n=1 Tax=Buddleja alternifolia TaxID=168488 RepID=A0AAV6X4W1_9LAMI|nr:hypothetical protein BUALT_Bualt08G0089100 [Buddleja alternifolia]